MTKSCEISWIRHSKEKGFDIWILDYLVKIRVNHDNCVRVLVDHDGHESPSVWKLNASVPFIKHLFSVLKPNCRFDKGFWNKNSVIKIRRAWLELMDSMPKDLLAFDKRLYQVTNNPYPSFIMEHYSLIKLHNHLISDVYNLRPAAIVVDNPGMFFNISCKQFKIGNERAIDHYPSWGFAQGNEREYILAEESIERMAQDWKRCYSYNLKPYTSLNKTLSNFPNVDADTASKLNQFKLKRPLLTKAELWLTAWGYTKVDEDSPIEHNHIFMHSTQDQIKRALKLMSAHQRRSMSVYRSSDVIDLAQFALDYPEPHNGNLVGLINKSIKFHRELRDARIDQIQYPPEKETRRPPIPLPKSNKVKFLATVEDVIKESETMNHCIFQYANQAVRGISYLFHVDYNNYQASIQIDASTGRIVQSYGPWNSKNKATKWGSSYLKQWAKKIKSGVENVF